MLDHLKTFAAVVDEGSFSAAARRLHKAQSAISYGVQTLEANLGVTLLDRSGHRAELTDAGRVVLEESRRLLGAARRLEDLAARLRQGWEARLAIVVDGILPQAPIMRALKTLADDAVPTQIEVKVEFLGGVQHRFERDDAHMMLVKDYRARPDYRTRELPELESVLVAAPHHPVAGVPGIELQALHEHVELSIHDSSDAPDAMPDATAFGGHRVFYLSDFMAKRQALKMGLGFGWMPLYMIRTELEEGSLLEVEYVGGSRYSFAPKMIWRDSRAPGPTAQRFAALLRENLEEKAAW